MNHVSEIKKVYIVESLNPILEACVADTIRALPDDPVAYMREWMVEKAQQDDDGLMTERDQDILEKENASLEEQLEKYKAQLVDCATAVYHTDTAPAGAAEEEEDEDDDVEEPPGFCEGAARNVARGSVSGEAYGEWNERKMFVPPNVQKTAIQKSRLAKVLSNCLLFSCLDPTQLGTIIGAMKETQVEEEDAVITQGEMGDCLYVIESGSYDCVVGFGEQEKKVKVLVTGDVFGELALMYNSPRAATVRCTVFGVCWTLDRETFNYVVRDAARKRRDRYEGFLAKVPLLNSMNPYERAQLCDAMRTEQFTASAIVMTQGEAGNKFYIIEEGSAFATKDGGKVMDYAVGDYFGELALITDQPRAATVTAKSALTLLSVDQDTFKRLLDVKSVLDRTKKYT